MKFSIFASLLASATAFTPSPKAASSSTALQFELEEGGQLGAQVPLGVWDPLGMIKGKNEGKFERLRYVEIKHGRIAMMAFLGQITTRNGVHFDANIDYAGHAFSSYPNGIAALVGPNAIPLAGSLQILAFIGFCELFFMKSVDGTGNEFIGDFRNGWIDFGWDVFDEDVKLQKRATELNNGRAAQMGILGLMVHEKLADAGMAVELPIIGTLQ